MKHWYGAKEKTLEIISGTGLWYRTGTLTNATRWVLWCAIDGKMEPQAFFCTDTDMDPAEASRTSQSDGKTGHFSGGAHPPRS